MSRPVYTTGHSSSVVHTAPKLFHLCHCKIFGRACFSCEGRRWRSFNVRHAWQVLTTTRGPQSAILCHAKWPLLDSRVFPFRFVYCSIVVSGAPHRKFFYGVGLREAAHGAYRLVHSLDTYGRSSRIMSSPGQLIRRWSQRVEAPLLPRLSQP